MHDDVQAALVRTKAMIERGWCQGRNEDGDRRCLAGALAHATTSVSGPRQSWQVWSEALTALKAHLPKGCEDLVVFNDHPDITQADVLALIDKALA